MSALPKLISEIDAVFPKLGPVTIESLRRLVPSGANKDTWKSLLLIAEAVNELTNRKYRLPKAAIAVSAVCAGVSVVSSKISAAPAGHYMEWENVSRLSGIPTPKKIACVPVGPVPPRVVAAVVNEIHVGNEVKFHEDYESDFPVTLCYTSIASCTKHGTTYSITIKPRSDAPYIVLKCAGSYFLFKIPTISVGNMMMVDVVRDMLVCEGTNCTAVRNMIVNGIMSTFDPARYMLYPSRDIATLSDTYARHPVDMNVTHPRFAELYHEMHRALDYGISRRYMFHGAPGTGKTMLAMQLAWKMNYVPLVILPAAKVLTVNYPLDSMGTYLASLLEIHRKAIIIMDDIDGCEIVDKTLATTRLIAFMDTLKESSEAGCGTYVLITTANDIGNISDTIVGRSGRIDKLVRIDPPNREMISKYDITMAPEARLMEKLGFTMADIRNAFDTMCASEINLHDAVIEVGNMKKEASASRR